MHMQHGATSLFPTIVAPDLDTIERAAAVCEEVMAADSNSPVMGMHIEGPYLNPKMAASLFIDQVNEANAADYRALLERVHCIRRWDASPEIPGALDFARYLTAHGIMASLSHTEAEYEDVKKADAIRMASETPARLMGVIDRVGTLERGKDANILILDKEQRIRSVWKNGFIVPGTNQLEKGA